MVRAALLLLAMLGIVAGYDCQAAGIFVNLLPEAQVDRPEIRLADIARMVGREPGGAQQLGAVVVATCPTLARPCRLEMAGFLPAIQTQAAKLGTTLLWGANETVTITGRRRQLPLAPAIEQAAARILLQLNPAYPVALGITEAPVAVDVPPGPIEFRPEFDQIRRFGTTIELPITVLVDGVSVARPLVRYALRRVAAAVAADMPARGANPRPEQKQAPGQTSISAQKEKGAMEGLSGDVAIGKNKKVRLLIATGPVQVETEGIALSDAALGALVDVRRANGQADIRGRAVDSDTVLVEEK